MARTTAQRTCRIRRLPTPTPTTDDATTCVVLTGAPVSVAPSSTAVEPVWLASASIGRSSMMRATDRAHDRPAAERGADGERDPARELHPRRRVERRGLAAREQQERDDADGLLRVVGAVAEREPARHHPLPAAHRAAHAARRACASSRRATRSATNPAAKPDDGRDGEHGHHADHADGLHAVEAAPVDGRRSALDERGPDETAEQRVARSSTAGRATT